MESKILKKQDIVKLNLDKAYHNVIFTGSKESNLDKTDQPILIDPNTNRPLNTLVEAANSSNWVGTKEYYQHWNKIEALQKKCKEYAANKQNVAQFPSDYYDLIDAISLDITRRRIQEADLTTVISNEVIRFDFSKIVDLREFLGFVGVYRENNLAGDAVPLIQQKTGVKGNVEHQGYTLGDVRSLESVLYDTQIYTLQKINEAYTRAYIGLRNHLLMGPMINLSATAGWNANQTVAADTTANATLSERMYRTMNAAIETIGNLYDFQRKQEITLSRLLLVTGRNVDARKVDRAIRGQLNNSKGINSNREALEIDAIVQYKGDTFFYNKERIEYPRVANNKAYLLVPGTSDAPHWTLVKRTPTIITGNGNALTLGQDVTTRYFVQTSYTDEWYGSSSTNSTIIGDTSNTYGYVIEVNLPS